METPPTSTASARSPRAALIGILLVAALLRLGHWWAVRDQPFVHDLVMDSWEYDQWGQTIASGDWLGDQPFFQAPLYPYLLGALYGAIGHSVTAAYLLQIAVAVLSLLALYAAGVELGNEGVGLVAAALAATTGVLIFHDVQLLKESFATSAMAVLLWGLLRARRVDRWPPWLGCGVLLGVVAGLRENALLIAPLLAALPWVGRSNARRAAAASAALLAGVALALLPWAARNLIVTGEPLLTTYQGGVNFYIGNHPGASGTYQPIVPGKQIPELERSEPVRLARQALGRPVTATEVSRYWLGRSLTWAREEPGAFLALQVRKLRLFWSFYEWPDAVDFYWMRERSPALVLAGVEVGSLALLACVGAIVVAGAWQLWSPVFAVVLGWTAATVIFFVFSRYRLPMVPALCLLAAVPLARLGALARERRWRLFVPGAAAALALLALPHVVGYRPRGDLVHYNLARVYARRGDEAAAELQYRLALEANPRDFLSLMNLGNAAARRGSYAQALALYRRAEQIEPDSDAVLVNLGGAELTVGDLQAADQAVRRALELDPQSLEAEHLAGLIAERRGDFVTARAWNHRVLAQAPDFAPARRLEGRLSHAGRSPADAQ